MLKRILIVVIIVAHHCMFAQSIQIVENVLIKESRLNFLGKTQAVSSSIKGKATSHSYLDLLKVQKKKPNNFVGRGHSNVVDRSKEHQGVDPLWQKDKGITYMAPPLVNVEGLRDFTSPHDPSGDVSHQHYVQMINATVVGVFSKDGTLIEQFAANTLWQPFGIDSAGDPIVLYDESADRWFVTEFADPSNVLIAVSETSDPLGSYFTYNFSTPDFPDYPKYAIWPDALLLTTNEGGSNILEQYVFDKKAMLQGSSDVKMQRLEVPGSSNTEGGFFVSTPIDWNGQRLPENNAPLFLVLNDSSWGSANQDQVDLYRINIDWNNANSTNVEKISIVTTPYDAYPCSETGFGFSCVPQKEGSGLDALPEVIMNLPHYRNFESYESIVFSFITDVTDGQNTSGIRWTELRRTTDSEWKVYQEGSFAPNDGLQRFMPSIAIDHSGNIGLAYNVTSKNTYVGIRFTGRLANDPLGEMTMSEQIAVTGLGPILSGSRFGDYAQMSVDPVENIFWYTSEYGNDDQGSKTRIVAFNITKDSFDLASIKISKPQTGDLLSKEEVTVDVLNKGAMPIYNFKLNLFLDEDKIDEAFISDTIDPGQLYSFTFANSIDLSEIMKTYTIKVWSEFEKDLAKSNDTVTTVIKHLTSYNAELLDVNLPTTICDTLTSVALILQNMGGRAIDSVLFKFVVDGKDSLVTVFTKTSLQYDQLDTIIVSLDLSAKGQHSVAAQMVKINDFMLDTLMQIPFFKNTTQKGIDDKYILNLAFDKFPNENSWNMRYKVGSQTIYSSGQYSIALAGKSIDEELCLQPDTCYRFTLRDGAANGMCCAFGNGNVTFTKATSREVKFMSDGEFKFTYNAAFCTTSDCQMELSISTSDDLGKGEGVIAINVLNGPGGYTYSIDGGITFGDKAIFENLTHGVYKIVVKSALADCIGTDSVQVKLSNQTHDVSNNHAITIYPNPNDGYIHIAITAEENAPYQAKYFVLDANGTVLFQKSMNRYNLNFESTVSLVDYPSGTYFIQSWVGNKSLLKRVIKN